MIGLGAGADKPLGLEGLAYYALLAFAAVVLFSIAGAHVLLTVTAVLWLLLVLTRRERVDVPQMFWPLAAYGAATLVSAFLSIDPVESLRDSKQLVLFLIVPIVYRLMTGQRSLTAADLLITFGAISATLGIFEYGILKWDDLGQRPRGTLGLYMTYSGQLMLVACVAAARVLFLKRDRVWAALVLPALIVALATTFSRNAWVGACAGIGLLLLIRDLRLVALVPVIAAVLIAFAPAQISDRVFSTFQFEQRRGSSETTQASVESVQDRLAMIRSGLRIVRDHPLTGVGPDMVSRVYPQYRDPLAVNQGAAHLHNVPLQIAAERGLPALGVWLWFVFTLGRDFVRKWKTGTSPSLAAAGLAAVVAMVAAGMFEYNFGDSEFLMLFLVVVTLPYAAERTSTSERPAVSPRAA